MSKTLISQNALKNLKEISPDPDFIKEYLEALLSPLPQKLQEIESAINSSDCEAVRKSAHFIKSSCLNAEIKEIVDKSFALEQMGRNENLEGSKAIFEELKKLCDQLRIEVESMPEFQ